MYERRHLLKRLGTLIYRDIRILLSNILWLVRDLVAGNDQNEQSLLNNRYIREYITHQAPWAESHGSDNVTYLGAGLLYYSLAYMTKAKLCVCLGSGGGYVPRLMRQAQRDLNLKGAKTILVDANISTYGRPDWIKSTSNSRESFFIREYPEIDIIQELTADVAKKHRDDWKIDYLHIDADHSFEGSIGDFQDYKGLMSSGGIITFHDTNDKRVEKVPSWKALESIKAEGHEVVNFPSIGAGVAIIKLLEN